MVKASGTYCYISPTDSEDKVMSVFMTLHEGQDIFHIRLGSFGLLFTCDKLFHYGHFWLRILHPNQHFCTVHDDKEFPIIRISE
jgi:hypothetical protein